MAAWGDVDGPVEDVRAGMESASVHDSGGDRAPVERKRLQLAPRSEAGTQAAAARGGAKSNPFGAAKPREEVLAAAGVNAAEFDKKIEKKAAPVRLTREQEEEIAAIQAELAFAEGELKEANENELPEWDLQVKVNEKKRDLDTAVAKFAEVNKAKREAAHAKSGDKPHNAAAGGAGAGGARGARGGAGGPAASGPKERPKFERPSERRRRLEEQDREEGGGGGGGQGGRDPDQDFSGFGGNRGGGGGYDRRDRGSGGESGGGGYRGGYGKY